MDNPFPGMNPYLEAHWRDVHTSLMVYIRDQLQEQLPGDLIARVEENVAIDIGDSTRVVAPDVRVVEEPTEWERTTGGNVATSAVAVAEPLLVVVDEPVPERHVEIIDPKSGNRVVTAIEVISPTNKCDIEGRLAYRRKQREYLAGGVNLVEIDLLRTGEHILAMPRDSVIPSRSSRSSLYFVCVRRARRLGLAEVVPLPLRERLPAVAVPLRRTDRDVVLDLQELIHQCYRRGRYSSIDYRKEPEPPLTGDDVAWADSVLRVNGLR